MNPETNPPQSEDVDRAIADLLAGDASNPDPWWEAGVEDALEE